MTFSKNGNKERRQSLQRVKTPAWAILEAAAAAFCRSCPSIGLSYFWSMTGVGTVFRNKTIISWAGESPHYTFCFLRFGFPGLYPRGVSEKGGRVSLTETGRFLPVFAASGSRCRCPGNQLFY
jgi:hypothetical protein